MRAKREPVEEPISCSLVSPAMICWMVEAMVVEVGEEAQVAIVTASLTAPNQNAWIEEHMYQRPNNVGWR